MVPSLHTTRNIHFYDEYILSRSQIYHNLWRKRVRHRSCVTLAYLWWIWQNHHRSVLICDEKQIVIELFWHTWQGLPHWWTLPLEMLFMRTCYSRLHWRWFRYVSPSYYTMWPSLVLARFRFLLDHVLFPCCSTYQFSTSTRIVLPLDHVSLFHLTTCCIFTGLVSASYLTTRHYVVCPRVVFLYVHMAWRFPSTCQVFNSPRVVPWPIHMSFTGSSTCRISWHVLILPRRVQSIRQRSNSRSSLLHRLAT
jgi:hypothetical protein